MTTDTPTPRSRRLWPLLLLAFFALGVLTRCLFLSEVHDDPVYVVLGHDEAVNDQVARAILAGQMPEKPFYKAPLYMYSMAGVYAVLGEDPGSMRWLQAVVLALPAVLLAMITRRLFGLAPAVLAGLLGAVYWGFVFYSTELVDTTLAACLYLFYGYVLIVLPDRNPLKWLACGLVLGLGIITRPNIMASGPVVVLTILYCGVRRHAFRAETDRPATLARRLASTGLAVVLFVAGTALTVSPVTLHNGLVGGQFVPIATYGGLNAWSANSPWSNAKDGSVLVSEEVPDISSYDPDNLWSRLDLNLNIAKSFAENEVGHPLTMGQADRYLYARTVQFILNNPGKFAFDTFKRFCWFFNAHDYCNLKDMYRICEVSTVLNALAYLHWGVLCPFAVIGVVAAIRLPIKTNGLLYYGAVLAALFLGGLLFVMHSRFRLPTLYIAMPFAAYGLVHLATLFLRPATWIARSAYVALLVLAAVFCNIDWFDYSVSGHTELQLTYAQACMQEKRLDMLADATAAFEEAYWDEVRNGGMPWVLTLHHIKPLTWLFSFYHTLENREKCLEYGRLMVQREKITPPVFLAYFDLLLNQRMQAEARRAVDALQEHHRSNAPGLLIESLIRFHHTFTDRPALQTAERILRQELAKHPKDDYLNNRLADVRELLGDAPDRPATRPAPQATQPTREDP